MCSFANQGFRSSTQDKVCVLDQNLWLAKIINVVEFPTEELGGGKSLNSNQKQIYISMNIMNTKDSYDVFLRKK